MPVGRPQKTSDERRCPPKAYYYEPHDEIKNGDPELDTYRFALWSMRLRATSPRIRLLRFFREEKGDENGSTVQELADRLSLPTATLYRAVRALVAAGLLTRLDRKPSTRTPASYTDTH